MYIFTWVLGGQTAEPTPDPARDGRAPGSDLHTGRPQTRCVKALGDMYNWEGPWGPGTMGLTWTGYGDETQRETGPVAGVAGRCRGSASSRHQVSPRVLLWRVDGLHAGQQQDLSLWAGGHRPQGWLVDPTCDCTVSLWLWARPRLSLKQPCRHSGQSSLSTFPMIFSSKMGNTASSSRTSSNTTPQSNSSLTFLK